jgi:putative oxidoreductase
MTRQPHACKTIDVSRTDAISSFRADGSARQTAERGAAADRRVGGEWAAKIAVPLPSAGLLVLRLVVGVTFVLHGIDKLGDMSGTEQFFASLGIPAPGLMAPFVAVTETVGGVLLIVGLATPLVGLALAGDMLVALLTAHVDQGFFVGEGGFELVLLLGGASLAIALTGAGRFSIDAVLGVTRRLWLRVIPAAGKARTGTRN